MGRLIDADKLKAQIEAHEIITKFSITEYECGHNVGLCIGIDEVDEADTIEAIPVDWIQRYINACEMVSVMDGGTVTKWSADAVKAMLECWREEQLPTCGHDYCEIGEIHD